MKLIEALPNKSDLMERSLALSYRQGLVLSNIQNESDDPWLTLSVEMLTALPSDQHFNRINFAKKVLKLAPQCISAWWVLLNSLAASNRGSELCIFAKIAHETFKSEPSFLYYLGWGSYLIGNHNQAIIDWSKVLELDPSYDPALYWLGDLYFEQGSLDQSLYYFDLARNIATDKAGYLSRYALCVLLSGNQRLALELAEQALKKDPNCLGNVNNVAEVLFYAGELNAVEDLLIDKGDSFIPFLERVWVEKNRSHETNDYVPLYKRLLGRFNFS